MELRGDIAERGYSRDVEGRGDALSSSRKEEADAIGIGSPIAEAPRGSNRLKSGNVRLKNQNEHAQPED